MNRIPTVFITLFLLLCGSIVPAAEPDPRPNILFCIADDWGWPHASVYGDSAVKTPTFDRLAREGVLFSNAFVACPSCTASRGAALTGQWPHRLEEGANLHSRLHAKFKTYPDILEEQGYVVGYTRKGWGPGVLEGTGRTRNPAGPAFKDFAAFLKTVPKDKPFCFWFGSTDPHRPYERKTEAETGIKLEDVTVPPFLPDLPEIRRDIRDYYFEVQRFDREVGELLDQLENVGLAEHTIVLMTGDHGMPFPRAKTNLYDSGTHVPLAVRWPGKVAPGRLVDDFISFTDFAPTFLQVAGIEPLDAMTGKPFTDVLLGDMSGRIDPARDKVFLERERHTVCRPGAKSYPVRAVRTADFMYIRNLRPELYPSGSPTLEETHRPYGDIDGGPSRDVILEQKDDPTVAFAYRLACEKRPAEELYDLKTDPDQLTNLAGTPGYAEKQRELRAALDAWMEETADPRAGGQTDCFDKVEYHGRLENEPKRIAPLLRTVDLNIGESQTVTLVNGNKAVVRLIDVQEKRDNLRDALRRALVTVEVNGKTTTLTSGTYHLPVTVGGVQIDCPVTKGYTVNCGNVWAIEKDARLRLWPEKSPWVRPGTFGYPVDQRWFASYTLMSNEIGDGEEPAKKQIYYHWGLDFGGCEGLVDVLAATDAIVISAGDAVLPAFKVPSSVNPRYDVVYLRDGRGWYYRYSHLHEIAEGLKPGGAVKLGQRIGSIGKRGASGGWTHLHFDVSFVQPSGEYGISDAYAFVWEAYRRQFQPKLFACARPHQLSWTGEPVIHEATRSWSFRGPEHIVKYEWTFENGDTAEGPVVTRTYDKPGAYDEIVKITDAEGNADYDFSHVRVVDPKHPDQLPPSVHAAYYPTRDLRPGQEITFKCRSFAVKPEEAVEVWDFGDGSEPVETKTDGNVDPHNPEGYAVLKHAYEKPGTYLVTVKCTNSRGETGTAHLVVRVEE